MDGMLQRAEGRIRQGDYSEANKNLIFQFENYLFASGASAGHIKRYLVQLNIISEWVDKDFTDLTESDMYRIVGNIERSDRSETTNPSYKHGIKKFYKWINNGTEPDITKWIRTAVPNGSSKLPEKLLTQTEAQMKEHLGWVQGSNMPAIYVHLSGK